MAYHTPAINKILAKIADHHDDKLLTMVEVASEQYLEEHSLSE